MSSRSRTAGQAFAAVLRALRLRGRAEGGRVRPSRVDEDSVPAMLSEGGILHGDIFIPASEMDSFTRYLNERGTEHAFDAMDRAIRAAEATTPKRPQVQVSPFLPPGQAILLSPDLVPDRPERTLVVPDQAAADRANAILDQWFENESES